MVCDLCGKDQRLVLLAPAPTTYRAWRAATPEDFVFALKGSRHITHMRRLKDVASGLANFFASGLLPQPPDLSEVSGTARTTWAPVWRGKAAT